MSNPSAQIYQTPLTEATSAQKEVLGSLRWHKNKCYKYIKYNQGAGAVAGVAGNMTYYHGTAGSQEVTSDVSDSVGVGAGVLQAAMTHGQFGWIQTKGPATLTPALTAGADGNALTAVGAGDGTLDVSALVTDHICAIALDASAKLVLLQCPD